MNGVHDLTFYHSPQTRSTGVLILLHELAANYRLHLLNMKKGEQKQAPFLAINPMGKVPAITDNGALITEQSAIYLYLSDLFPEAGLAPSIGDPLRGPYLRWMVFYSSCFEPAIIDRSQKRESAPVGMSPYGDFDTMFNTLLSQLEKAKYLLGDRFSSADILWGTSLGWITQFQLIPTTSVISEYIERINSRPSIAWAKEKENELLASME